MRNLVGLLSILFSGAPLWAQTAQTAAPKDVTLKFVSYNVENMFDARHDADESLPDGKEDWTFLPLNHALKSKCLEMPAGFYKTECQKTDWSDTKAKWKVKNAALALGLLKGKPDVVALAEVENANVVGALAKELGYANSFLVTESPDRRGIDVALIYNSARLKLVKSAQIRVEGTGMTKPTRNILRVEFALLKSNGQAVAGQKIFVYANHWPSQAAPSPARVLAANILKNDIESLRAENTNPRLNQYFIAMGDFNTIPEDSPHPFDSVVLSAPAWATSPLVDVENYARREVPALEASLLPGSYWFSRNQAWNKLDHIFVSQNLIDKKGADVIPSTFTIVKNEKLMQAATPTSGPFSGQSIFIPKRFDSQATTQANLGFSDHLPISVDVKLPLN